MEALRPLIHLLEHASYGHEQGTELLRSAILPAVYLHRISPGLDEPLTDRRWMELG